MHDLPAAVADLHRKGLADAAIGAGKIFIVLDANQPVKRLHRQRGTLAGLVACLPVRPAGSRQRIDDALDALGSGAEHRNPSRRHIAGLADAVAVFRFDVLDSGRQSCPFAAVAEDDRGVPLIVGLGDEFSFSR